MREPGIRRGQSHHTQRGSVLLVTLILLLVSVLVSTATLEGAMLQARLVHNSQLHSQAWLHAEGVARAMLLSRDHYPLSAPVGHVGCADTRAVPICDDPALELPAAGSGLGSSIRVQVTRKAPMTLDGGVLDERPWLATAPGVSWAVFELRVDVTGDSALQGQAALVAGVLVPLSAGAPRAVYWRDLTLDRL
ncbi:MAG: hypothetical protein AAGA91_08450 [Pseudomonadota bacterium]